VTEETTSPEANGYGRPKKPRFRLADARMSAARASEEARAPSPARDGGGPCKATTKTGKPCGRRGWPNQLCAALFVLRGVRGASGPTG
jgi:hypothetical protein